MEMLKLCEKSWDVWNQDKEHSSFDVGVGDGKLKMDCGKLPRVIENSK